MKTKVKIAFFDFTCCEGCQLQIANLGPTLIDLLQHLEIVAFREVMTGSADNYDVAVIEGAISTDHDIERIQAIRAKAKVLIALGSCATIGGVNAMKNFQDIDEAKKRVYGDKKDKFNSIPVKAVHQVVKADYFINGCPILPKEALEVFKAALLGKRYEMPNYPVCTECKMNENVCMYDKKQNCLGPVTRAGCNSWCVNNGNICYGCRGLVDNPASDAQKDILAKYGLRVEEILNKFTLYGGCQEEKYAQPKK
jgi:coenzyme F420-reducing hydrogenase gamma subunit